MCHSPPIRATDAIPATWAFSPIIPRATDIMPLVPPMPYHHCHPCSFCREKFKDVFAEGSTANGTTRRHAKENYDRAVETVQTTEHRLSIEVRWTTEDPEWIQAAELVTMRRYRRAINTLEGLVVKRILELTKVNQSGLGQRFL